MPAIYHSRCSIYQIDRPQKQFDQPDIKTRRSLVPHLPRCLHLPALRVPHAHERRPSRALAAAPLRAGRHGVRDGVESVWVVRMEARGAELRARVRTGERRSVERVQERKCGLGVRGGERIDEEGDGSGDDEV